MGRLRLTVKAARTRIRRVVSRRVAVPLAVTTVGAAASLAGVYVLFGVGWALLVGGAASTVVGLLLDDGK